MPRPSTAAAQRSFFKIGIASELPQLFLLLRRMVAETNVIRKPPSDASVIASEAKQSIEPQARYGLLCRFAPRNDDAGLPPRKHRLFQVGHAGLAARQHFAELIDQGRRRCMDVLACAATANHAPCGFPDQR